MDDDPDPTPEQVILEGYEMSEQVLSVGELQKCSLEGNDENSVNQESGDTGPFLEQEVTKKTSSGKDAPDPALQTDNKVTILKRKELVDQSQTPDAAGSIKSSTTSLRKPSRRCLQWLPGQDSRRSSQQSVGQQTQPSQKSSRVQFINEVDTKDTTWVNKKTGKTMKCRSQQTSLIWERKVLSEILHGSSEESDRSKEETYSEEDTNSEETTAPEGSSGSVGHQSSQEQEGTGTTYDSPKQESCGNSEQSSEEPSLSIPKVIDSEEEITWISPKTGKEMKNKIQQTSIIWELKTLSEILRSSSQESFSHTTDTDITEDAITSSGETEVELSSVKESKCSILQPVRGQESPHSRQQQEEKEFRQDTQQLEESKAEPLIKKETYQHDQAQQTDSAESVKKELLDYSQQTEFFTDSKNASVDLKDSHHSTQQAEAQESRHGSQDSQRTVQDLLGSASQVSVGKETKVLTSLILEENQEPFFTGELDENTWISRKTGKVVKNQAQQTDKSWLQYCAAKRQKVKKCSSQQTDESFLQCYAANKMTMSGREAAVNNNEHGQQGLRKFSSGCLDAPNIQFSDRDMSSLGQDATSRKTSKAYEPTPAEGCEGVQQLQHGNDRLTDQSPATGDQWPDESESRSTVSASSIIEDDFSQQTYSIISLEDGIWLNRKTGKILISHTQQTSQTAVPTVLSTTSLQKAGSGVKEEELQSPGSGKDEPTVEQRKAKVDGQLSAGKESRRSSQANPDYDTLVITAQPLGENSQCTDDIEKLLSTRLSEAMLLSAESPDMEDEPVEFYTSVEEGSWMNVNTGRLLASQTQQTEEDADQFLVGDDQPSGGTFQQAPEILASSNNGTQLSVGEGMDDDPVSN